MGWQLFHSRWLINSAIVQLTRKSTDDVARPSSAFLQKEIEDWLPVQSSGAAWSSPDRFITLRAPSSRRGGQQLVHFLHHPYQSAAITQSFILYSEQLEKREELPKVVSLAPYDETDGRKRIIPHEHHLRREGGSKKKNYIASPYCAASISKTVVQHISLPSVRLAPSVTPVGTI